MMSLVQSLFTQAAVSFKEQDENGIENACDVNTRSHWRIGADTPVGHRI